MTNEAAAVLGRAKSAAKTEAARVNGKRGGRPRKADPLVAVGYIRTSRKTQRISPLAQRDAITVWATARGVTIAGWFEDLGVSGAAPLEKRPGLKAALDAVAKHGASALVVAYRDRLARDFVQAGAIDATLAKAGARAVSAEDTSDDSPKGRLLTTLLAAFEEYKRAAGGAP